MQTPSIYLTDADLEGLPQEVLDQLVLGGRRRGGNSISTVELIERRGKSIQQAISTNYAKERRAQSASVDGKK
jgi:hypothetical protein